MEMVELKPKSWNVLLPIAVLCAIFYPLYFTYLIDYESAHPRCTAFLFLFVSYTAIFFLMSDNGLHRARLFLTSTIAAALGAMLLPSMPSYFDARCYVLVVIVIYAIFCFHYTWHQANSIRVSYKDYFETLWNVTIVLIFAQVFFGLAWGIYFLLAAIFNLVGIEFFQTTLVHNTWFVPLLSPFFAVTGFYLAFQMKQAVSVFRFICLLISKWLFPALFVVMVLTLFACVIALFQPNFSQLPIASEAGIDLIEVLCVFAVILYNNVYQTGAEVNQLPRWYQRSFDVFPALLFALTVFLSVRFMFVTHMFTPQFAFTLNDMVGDAAINVLLICYSVGYLWGTYTQRTHWLSRVGTANVAVAWIWIILVVLLTNPIAYHF